MSTDTFEYSGIGNILAQEAQNIPSAASTVLTGLDDLKLQHNLVLQYISTYNLYAVNFIGNAGMRQQM
jgi:hypothetical protein